MLPGLDRFDKSGIKYFKEFELASNRLVEIAEAIINKRLESGEKKDDDLLGILLQMRDQISTDHIRDEVLTLILSGHETTANVMSWAFSYLAKNPEIRKQLEDEADNALWIKENRTPTYQELEESSKVTSAVLQETMRLAPPVWVAPRIATTDCIIDGVKIPKGAHVFGRHGGADTFDIPFVQNIIYKIAKNNPEIYGRNWQNRWTTKQTTTRPQRRQADGDCPRSQTCFP